MQEEKQFHGEYRIAGNFRGVQFLRFSRLIGKPRKLNLRNKVLARAIKRGVAIVICMLLDRSAGLLHTGTLLNFYRCRKNGRRVAYDRDCGPWLSRVQGNSVCCCWRRAILHMRGGELSPSVRCSSGKIWSNRRYVRWPLFR